jgi:hypothetical protein
VVTGLGLSLCKKLLESIGGEISVASVVDEGTTFTCGCRPRRLAPAPREQGHEQEDEKRTWRPKSLKRGAGRAARPQPRQGTGRSPPVATAETKCSSSMSSGLESSSNARPSRFAHRKSFMYSSANAVMTMTGVCSFFLPDVAQRGDAVFPRHLEIEIDQIGIACVDGLGADLAGSGR